MEDAKMKEIHRLRGVVRKDNQILQDIKEICLLVNTEDIVASNKAIDEILKKVEE